MIFDKFGYRFINSFYYLLSTVSGLYIAEMFKRSYELCLIQYDMQKSKLILVELNLFYLLYFSELSQQIVKIVEIVEIIVS